MDTRARELVKQGDSLFSGRAGEINRWQEIAANFYPERADFFGSLDGIGAADDLFNSYPVLARRELGNMVAAMLRPRTVKWFSAHVDDERIDNGSTERRYLEYVTNVQWRAMYDPVMDFVKAAKEADHDFISFGNAVLEITPHWQFPALLCRTHHIRDTAWSENASRSVDVVHRKLSLSARQLKELFGSKVSREVEEAYNREPDKPFDCRHIVVPERVYRPDGLDGRRRRRTPYTSFYIESQSNTVLEEVGRLSLGYVVPRWHSMSDSAYARSPATETSLPDGRGLQAVSRTLQEAGEKYVDPPLLAYKEALRSDLQLYAGGVTAVDLEYDERTGDAIRPIVQNPGAVPIVFDMIAALREDIRHGFFLDKLQLPQIDVGKMTAFEVQRRIEEHVRAAAPLFEPIEQQYSAPLCAEIFEQLKNGGAFGPLSDMPRSLLGQDIRFTFQSPLREVSDQARTGQFLEGLKVMQVAGAFDPSALATLDLPQATRDALRGLGLPATWFRDPAEVEKLRKQIEEQRKLEKGADALATGAGVAKGIGDAAQSWRDAGIGAPVG